MTSSGGAAVIVTALASFATCSQPTTPAAVELDPLTVLAAASQAASSVSDQADAQLVIRYIGVARVAALVAAGDMSRGCRY